MKYKDESTAVFTTDESWKWSLSPVTFNCIYGGEDYDARLEQDAWDRAGFDDSGWLPAVAQRAPAGELVHQTAPSDAVIDEFFPVKTAATDRGLVLDLAQNHSGIPVISVSGRPGQVIRIWPAERLDAGGFPDQRSTGSPHYYQYTLKGEGTESWQPRFSYYGYRWLLIEGAVTEDMPNPQGLPVLHSVKSLYLSNAME